MDNPNVVSFINCSIDLAAIIIIIFAFVLVTAYNYTLFTSFGQMSLVLLVTVFLYVTSNFLSWVSEYLC